MLTHRFQQSCCNCEEELQCACSIASTKDSNFNWLDCSQVNLGLVRIFFSIQVKYLFQSLRIAIFFTIDMKKLSILTFLNSVSFITCLMLVINCEVVYLLSSAWLRVRSFWPRIVVASSERGRGIFNLGEWGSLSVARFWLSMWRQVRFWLRLVVYLGWGKGDTSNAPFLSVRKSSRLDASPSGGACHVACT